jgi:hypothetical protein
MDVKEWLDKNEWPDEPIESDAYSHYTFMSQIMLKFAKEYHVHKLESAKRQEAVTIKKFI